jgi:hypothetical protein
LLIGGGFVSLLAIAGRGIACGGLVGCAGLVSLLAIAGRSVARGGLVGCAGLVSLLAIAGRSVASRRLVGCTGLVRLLVGRLVRLLIGGFVVRLASVSVNRGPSMTAYICFWLVRLLAIAWRGIASGWLVRLAIRGSGGLLVRRLVRLLVGGFVIRLASVSVNRRTTVPSNIGLCCTGKCHKCKNAH